VGLALACGFLLLVAIEENWTARPASAAVIAGVHEGVASCASSTCHSRLAPTGKTVRQNELITWQDTSSAAGSHSRAWQVLTLPRADAITIRMGLGPARNAPECLGCHADAVPASMRGSRFQISDGVGCEACHGGSGGWLASHYAIGASHADNVARGLTPLDDAKSRATLCLNCHFGSGRPGQFVSHRMMAAGHPRISFELDLFSTLQRHYDIDNDYASRKAAPGGVKVWAVGQAMALERALTLYGGPHGQEGAFPEFYFFDCHSCHRQISDLPGAVLKTEPNTGRPIPMGMPPFDDASMIMLSAAARTAAPGLADRFERDVRAFHVALAQDRSTAALAAARLATTARALADVFSDHGFSRADTFAILGDILERAAARYTDYAGGAQAVMAASTLLNAMIATGQMDDTAATALRADLDQLYAAVRDPNAWRTTDFRAAIGRLAMSARRSL